MEKICKNCYLREGFFCTRFEDQIKLDDFCSYFQAHKIIRSKIMIKVFLGGTCNTSTWRDRMIVYLEEMKIDYFNPVVPNWTEGCQAREIEERKTCNCVLYTITPRMLGFYSIAEVIDDSNKRPESTILIILSKDDHFRFNGYQRRSLTAISEMVERNGGFVFHSLGVAATFIYLNSQYWTFEGR